MQKPKYVQLICRCPSDCPCQEQVERKWHHKDCNTVCYLNDNGDIFCQKHLKNQESCDKYFIKDAFFQCSVSRNNETWQQYRSAADFLMAIAQGLKAAEFALKDIDLASFAQKLTTQIMMRWYE